MVLSPRILGTSVPNMATQEVVLNHLAKLLTGYTSGVVSLSGLVSELDGLYCSSSQMPEGWRREFYSAWEHLELSNALVLSGDCTMDAVQTDVLSAIGDFNRLMREVK